MTSAATMARSYFGSTNHVLRPSHDFSTIALEFPTPRSKIRQPGRRRKQRDANGHDRQQCLACPEVDVGPTPKRLQRPIPIPSSKARLPFKRPSNEQPMPQPREPTHLDDLDRHPCGRNAHRPSEERPLHRVDRIASGATSRATSSQPDDLSHIESTSRIRSRNSFCSSSPERNWCARIYLWIRCLSSSACPGRKATL